MTKVHDISSVLNDPRARQAHEDIEFKAYEKASRPSFMTDWYGRQFPYNPDVKKIIDIFEPAEGMFLVQEKDIKEQPKDYFFDIRAKMDRKYGYTFKVETLKDKGILIIWESDPDHDNTW
jgi:hypothetical protein